MRNELLHSFVETLKNNGFDVYTSDKKEDYSYCHFVKENKIGYVQTGYYGGLEFSTVHKPNKTTGTGFGFKATFEPTLEDAEKAFLNHPGWASHSDLKSVVKYKDWNDFFSIATNRILKEVQL